LSAFARALGFSSEFSSLLKADKRAPSFTTLNKIAAYLKKDIHDFRAFDVSKNWGPSDHCRVLIELW